MDIKPFLLLPDDCCNLIFVRSTAPQDVTFFGTLIKKGQDVWVSETRVDVDDTCKTLIGLFATDSADGRNRLKICNCRSECFVEGTMTTDPATGLDKFVGQLKFAVDSVCCLPFDQCIEGRTCE